MLLARGIVETMSRDITILKRSEGMTNASASDNPKLDIQITSYYINYIINYEYCHNEIINTTY